VTRLGFLTAIGTALYVLESFIPLPLPFLKIGLANVSTLIMLFLSGPVDALIVVFLRVMIGSFLTGSFLSPSFLLAFAAGILSALTMGLIRTAAPSLLGPIGLSLAGATMHVCTQLAIVAFLYVHNLALIHLLPVLLLTGLIGGLVVGFITLRLLPALASTGQLPEMRVHPAVRRMYPADTVAVIVLLACTMLSFVIVPGSTGSKVVIQVDGRTVATMDLRTNGDLTVPGFAGRLRVEVREGKVRVAEAQCPNKICVRTGWRSMGDDVIVCVPNRTVIRILEDRPHTVGGITG
jgi:heptaprenyl diphosphate synthase